MQMRICFSRAWCAASPLLTQRQTGIGETGRLQRRVSHSQDRPSTGGAVFPNGNSGQRSDGNPTPATVRRNGVLPTLCLLENPEMPERMGVIFRPTAVRLKLEQNQLVSVSA